MVQQAHRGTKETRYYIEQYWANIGRVIEPYWTVLGELTLVELLTVLNSIGLTLVKFLDSIGRANIGQVLNCIEHYWANIGRVLNCIGQCWANIG